MNKTFKIAIAAAFATAVSAQAAGFTTWTLADHGGQVPSQGYWFGYDDQKEAPTPAKDDGVGLGCSSTDFPPGSDEDDIVTEAWQNKPTIDFNFNTKESSPDQTCTYKYRFAGFGFNWFGADGDIKTLIKDECDPTGGATNIKVKYKLSTDPGVKCFVELAADGVTAYDNYVQQLTSGDNLADGVTFAFSNFSQADWGTTVSFRDAWANSEGFKFKCEAGTYTTGQKAASLEIREITFNGTGECTAPILKFASVSAGLNMTQSGRTVSLSVPRSAPVQVINLQGAVVHTQTLSPESRDMNLSHLSVGVYMVRVPALGYTNRVILK